MSRIAGKILPGFFEHHKYVVMCAGLLKIKPLICLDLFKSCIHQYVIIDVLSEFEQLSFNHSLAICLSLASLNWNIIYSIILNVL